MRVVFWGSPAFALATLEALLASPHEVAAVVTRPPRPRGRGRSPEPTPVAAAAAAAGVPVLAPEKPRGESFLEGVRALSPDVFVVAAYGEILPPAALELPPLGALNVHASLLPAYRGAAPVTRAILDGVERTGVTIMRMDAGLDTGPICLAEEEPVWPEDTAGAVAERLARRGARLALEALDRLEEGRLPERPQDDAVASYAPKVSTREAEIDWSRPTAALERGVRAYDPWPGAWTTWRDERIKVFRLERAGTVPDAGSGPPGMIVTVDPVLVVRTGDGAAALAVVQPPGGRRMGGAEWARGRDVVPGDRLGDGGG